MKVEILQPPDFSKTGKIVDVKEARKNGWWYGTFNLWVVTRTPVPSIFYQLRGPKMDWGANKLDVLLAGHYDDGESIESAISHEEKEELGIAFNFSDMIPLGRRLNVGVGTDGSIRNTVSDLFLVEQSNLVDKFQPTDSEVYAICSCPLDELLKVHVNKEYKFTVKGVKFDRSEIEIEVNQSIFPYNWDNYHYKMALVSQRYFSGESPLLY